MMSSRLTMNTLSSEPAVTSHTNGRRGNASSAAARLCAQFDDQRAARIEEARRLLEDRADRIEPVVAAGERQCRFVPIFGRQFLHRHRGDVGRIADDEVVGLFRQVGEKVGADEVDAVGQRVIADVALRHGQRG